MGSDGTLIPASVAKGITVTETNQMLTAANGTDIKLLGEVSLPITFGKYEGIVTGLVSEYIAEVMLGINWLVDNRIVLEFKQSRMKIGQDYYTLHRQSNANSWCRPVVLQDTEVVPPRLELDLPTKIVLRNFSVDTAAVCSNWGTEPGLVMDGVYVSRTVVLDDRFTDIPVCVMNVRSEALFINAGTSVADLQPVTMLGSIPVCETG